MHDDPLLPDDTRTYAAAVREFAQTRLRPGYQDRDREGQFDQALIRQMGALGLLGLRAPTALGGQDADAVTVGAVAEEVGRGDLVAGYLLNNASLVTEVLMRAARPEQRETFIPPIARGDVVPAICLTEPEHGSDAAAIEMKAEQLGDDWVLTGEKTSVTFGEWALQGLVFARTGGPGAGGVSAFYVDLDHSSITRSRFQDLGGRAIGRASIHFDGTPVGSDRLIGELGAGFTQVMQGFEFARAVIALICIGAASASLDEAIQHARDRSAFGQPIGRFQHVAFTLVEHKTKIAAARELALRALRLKDRGLPHAEESNMAKWLVPRLAVDAAHDAMLTFGHSGYSEEYPLGQRVRDIMGLEIGDGTAGIAKLVVARSLLGREFAP